MGMNSLTSGKKGNLMSFAHILVQSQWYCSILFKKNLLLWFWMSKWQEMVLVGIKKMNLCALSLKPQKQYFDHILINVWDFNSLSQLGTDEVTSNDPSHPYTCLQPPGITFFVLDRGSQGQQQSWRQIPCCLQVSLWGAPASWDKQLPVWEHLVQWEEKGSIDLSSQRCQNCSQPS